jgi:hypothetical protein
MQILNFKASKPEKFELGTFDLCESWRITRRFKLLKSKRGNYYFKSASFKDEDNNLDPANPNWKPYAEFYGPQGEEFINSVIKLLEPYIQTLPQREEPEQLPF